MSAELRVVPEISSDVSDFTNQAVLHGVNRALGRIEDGNGLRIRQDIRIFARRFRLRTYLAPQGEQIAVVSTDEYRDTPLSVEKFNLVDQEWELALPGSSGFKEAVSYRNLSPIYVGKYAEFDESDGQIYVYRADRSSRVHLDEYSTLYRQVAFDEAMPLAA